MRFFNQEFIETPIKIAHYDQITMVRQSAF